MPVLEPERLGQDRVRPVLPGAPRRGAGRGVGGNLSLLAALFGWYALKALIATKVVEFLSWRRLEKSASAE